MKKFIIYLLYSLAFFSGLYSMEKNTKESEKFSVKEGYINRLPYELIQKICLLSESSHIDISTLITRLLKLRTVNKEWRYLLEQEFFWKRAFVNLFENIISEHGLPSEQQLLKCKKIDSLQMHGQIYQTIRKCLDEIIKDEQFWKTAYYDFFKNFMVTHSYLDFRQTINKCKEIVIHTYTVPEKIDNDQILDLWLKIVPVFAEALRDAQSCCEITDAIYSFKFEEIKKLIKEKRNDNYKLWNFSLLQTAVEALGEKKSSFESQGWFDLAKWSAIQSDTFNFIKYLIESGDINIDAKGFSSYTALMLAAHFGLVDVIDILMQHGASIDTKSSFGSQAIMFACEAGQLEATEKLISYGADIFAKSSTINGSALGYATRDNQLVMVEKLLNYGLDPNEEFKNHWTALMSAAKYDHVEVAKVLLTAGAKPNAQDIEGLTPLMIACIYLNHKMIKLLVSLSDLNFKNKKGETATEIMLKLVQKLDEKRIQIIGKKPKKECEIIQILVQSGTDANMKNDKGETALEILSDLYQKLDLKVKKEEATRHRCSSPPCGPYG